MRIRQYAVDLVYKEPETEERFPSERELCAMFNVTRPTVRRALHDLIEEGFLIIHPGLGTFTNPRKAGFQKHSAKPFSVAIISGSGKLVFYTSFHAGVLSGIFSYIGEIGGFIRIVNIISTGENLVNEVKRLNVDGVIWVTPPEQSLIERLSAAEIHVISVNRGYANRKINYCGFDFRANGKMIADYFLDRGIEDVVFALNSEIEFEAETFAGFTKAYSARGVTYNKCLALSDPESVGSDIRKMLELGVKFGGIYTDGFYFPEIVESLRQNNVSIGPDMRLLTQRHIAILYPGIPCDVIALPMAEVGRKAAESLHSLSSRSSSRRVFHRIPGEIITRDS